MEDLNLIRMITWKFYAKNNKKIEFEELFAEASFQYCQALKLYDPTRDNKKSTYLWRFVWNGLINYCKKEVKYHQTQTKQSFEDPLYFQAVPFTEFYAQLPNDCKLIATLVLDSIDDYPDDSLKCMKKWVVDLLREHNWKWNRIWDGMREFKIILNKI